MWIMSQNILKKRNIVGTAVAGGVIVMLLSQISQKSKIKKFYFLLLGGTTLWKDCMCLA